MKITRISQSCFRIEIARKTIYIDPYKIKENEPKADVILISHPHPDHNHGKSIKAIVTDQTTTLCPASCKKLVTRWNATGIMPGEERGVAGIKIRGVPAYNLKKKLHAKEKGWLGFVISSGSKTIFHAGDSDFVDEMKEVGPVDVLMLPIGGTFTMNAAEAIEATKVINPAIMIPMHYFRTKPNAFATLYEASGVSASLQILGEGETFTID